MSHRGANSVGIDRVEHPERRGGIQRREDLSQHLRREARATHTQQDDVREPVLRHAICECAKPRQLWRHDVKGIEPAEPVRDQGLDGRIGGPNVQLLAPQRIRKADAIEARVRILECGLQWS